MLATMFRYGAFSATDVDMSAHALMAFSFALLGFILIKVLAPGFYARQDTKTPVRIGIISMVANVVLSLMLVPFLQHVGLALAISLAAFVNAGLLYRRLRVDGVYTPEPGWLGFLLRIVAASVLMGGLLWWGAGDLAGWLAQSSHVRVARLSFYVLAGMAVYGLALLVFGIRPRQFLLKKVTGQVDADE
jgi:putative peptidoglycan lipid II flippase